MLSKTRESLPTHCKLCADDGVATASVVEAELINPITAVAFISFVCERCLTLDVKPGPHVPATSGSAERALISYDDDDTPYQMPPFSGRNILIFRMALAKLVASYSMRRGATFVSSLGRHVAGSTKAQELFLHRGMLQKE